MATTAVIGAGISGIAAARALAQTDRVVVFEKSADLGGRMATRQIGDAAVDHGAQYLTVRTPEFAAALEPLTGAGVVAPWTAPVVTLADARTRAAPASERLVGVPGMSAIVRALAAGLEVRLETPITTVTRAGRQWELQSTHASLGTFDRVVLAVPAPQAVALMPLPALTAQIASASLAPCWAAVLALPGTLDRRIGGAFVQHPDVSWLARNPTRPRRAPTELWVMHATAAWSRAHLDEPAEDVAAALARTFATLLDAPLPLAIAHRWRYAFAEQPLGRPCVADPDAGIAACGDWCLGARVELAFQSGLAAAAAL